MFNLAYPVVHTAMICDQESFKLVWQCYQLLSGFLAKGHFSRASRQSSPAERCQTVSVCSLNDTLTIGLLYYDEANKVKLTANKAFKNNLLTCRVIDTILLTKEQATWNDTYDKVNFSTELKYKRLRFITIYGNWQYYFWSENFFSGFGKGKIYELASSWHYSSRIN